MSTKGNGSENPQSAKVLQLGFNISVSGDPDSDIQIVLDDKNQNNVLQIQDSAYNAPKQEIGEMRSQEEVKPAKLTGAIPKHKRQTPNNDPSEAPKLSDNKNPESTSHKDSTLIKDIKSTMEHFERFSDHIKEIPRLKSHPLATSTPFSDKQNSRSESSLIYPEYRSRKFPHLYDFHYRRDYFRGSIKPLPSDLYLKPLPGENLYRRGNFSRCLDLEPYRHYGSVDSLNKSPDYKSALCPKSAYDFDLEPPVGILKKSDSESGDKQSTSSADSIKDIRIYQSGGIIIMQNFKDNMDLSEKKEISDFSAKLIENCHKLREEIATGFHFDRPLIGNSSDEGKSGKMVQFDLSGFENEKSKSNEQCDIVKDDYSPVKMESSESTSDCIKKDSSPQGTSQSQDFPSLSTQENDSVISNQPGMSPTNATGKKLEWDSGADVGYLNMDLSKENLSTIERIVLKGISSDGLREKKVVYEKKPEQTRTNRSKFILERLPSDPVMEEVLEGREKTKKERKAGETSQKNKKDKPIKIVQEGVKNSEDEPDKTNTSKVDSKDESQSGGENVKPSAQEGLSPEGDADKPIPKVVESTDKSVNVNTLFEDSYRQTPVPFKSPIESKFRAVKLSPKVKKLKKKRVCSQRSLTAPLKDKIDSIIDLARSSGRSTESATFEMGIPKRIYKKVEANPELNDVELSRDVEEIIIDQRFKIKQNIAVGRENSKGSAPIVPSKVDDNVESKKETKTKSRPISASSSSNNTVLPNAEAKEEPKEKEIVAGNKFSDQIIQTTDCKVESVGIQAFASLKSSDGSSTKEVKEVPNVDKGVKEVMNTSSKNIQAFGLNSSLPKELAHPRGTRVLDNQNTKSTQFFGGPVNSLPNYHASLVTKPGESCGRMPKVLKAKKNLEAEIIRVKEENEKNIMANDNSVISEPKRKNNLENKENLMMEKSENSKRSQSNASRNLSKGNGSNEASKKESERSESKAHEKRTTSPEVSEGLRTSEEVSSKVLTSEVLKEHGDSIDRNIIQEKYFQSQLIELEKREMISRSTSMEKRLENLGRELMTVGCQYSPQSMEASEGGSKHQEPSLKRYPKKKKETSEQYDSSQNFGTSKSTNQQEFGAGDSLPSSTQTAHSWIPGMRDFDQDTKSGVGRARSFEYLPGHIYESSGNLREELPSETERNLMTSSSSDSNTAKHSVSEKARDSEGRNTLILENSSEASHESDKMKTLNDNLTQLDVVVAKLREKDAQIETITQTLLVNLWKNNGSGDSAYTLGGRQQTSISVGKSNGRRNFSDGSNSRRERDSLQTKRKVKEDNSIACQTEEKSSASDPRKFYEERKALEKRISAEKESQIKWIENEIHHLNILRELLEKQGLSSLRRKKRSSSSITSNDDPKIEQKLSKEISRDVYPRQVTPVYGCTISLVEKPPSESCPETRDENAAGNSCFSESMKYGMALSVTRPSNNIQSMLELPVELQLTLKDNKLTEECPEEEKTESSRLPCLQSPRNTSPDSTSKPCEQHRRVSHSNINTQYPSERRIIRNCTSTFAQTSFSSVSPRVCKHCGQVNCVCLDFFEKNNRSFGRSSNSQASGRNLRPNFYDNAESKMENDGSRSTSTGAEIQELESEIASKESHRMDSVQVSKCKCEKCPRRMSAGVSQPGVVSRSLRQSSTHLNCRKTSDGFGTCRCSKIEVQKSSICACHVIKIHGSKCSSNGNVIGSERMPTPLKKTQDQCSQTEEAKELTFETIEKTAGKITPRGSQRSEVEKMKTVEEESDVMKEKPTCNCHKKKADKEKQDADNHPRHYFLKIEEAEVDDDPNESKEQKKYLEVITVKVPVKKAGKAKIYGNRVHTCHGPCSKSTKEYDTADGRGYRKMTEKPESSRRCPTECDSYENVSQYKDDNYRYKDPNCQSLLSQEYYQEGNIEDFARAKSRYNDKTEKDNYKSRLDSCSDLGLSNSFSREIQNGYDSHKEGRRQNKELYYENERPRYEECRNRKRATHDEKPYYEKDSRVRPDLTWESRNLPFDTTTTDRYHPDYYNYNKREFMTKSELLREEEEKSRLSHPSLQDYLESNRPDFYNSAENRRQIISERARERTERQSKRIECLVNMLQGKDECKSIGSKRMFTTSQMREQTMKKYRNLPEVTGKIADQKKRNEYRTNKLMADIYGKKLQIEALKGCSMCNSENL